ncbi:MAG: cytochrome c oxidase accessory protein CcoG, partial [Zoogloea sp.]|nr:cytochrome c oxidase accessory protein CcoG [Zoogloea sp.]
RGSLAREATDGRIENAYTLKLANLAETPRDFEVEVSGLPGIELVGARRFAGEAGSIRAVQVTVAAPADGGPSGARPITFQVRATDDPSTRVTEKSTFVLP